MRQSAVESHSNQPDSLSNLTTSIAISYYTQLMTSNPVTRFVAGIAFGVFVFGVSAWLFSAWWQDPFSSNLALVALIILSGLVVACGRLLPEIALVAGLAILTSVGTAWATGTANPWVSGAELRDLRSLWVLGSGNLVTVGLGAALAVSAILELVLRRSKRATVGQ